MKKENRKKGRKGRKNRIIFFSNMILFADYTYHNIKSMKLNARNLARFLTRNEFLFFFLKNYGFKDRDQNMIFHLILIYIIASQSLTCNFSKNPRFDNNN